MSDVETVGDEIIANVDWRNDSPEDVYNKMEDIFQRNDLYEFTIDDLKMHFMLVDIAEIMQCYIIYTVMSVI